MSTFMSRHSSPTQRIAIATPTTHRRHTATTNREIREWRYMVAPGAHRRQRDPRAMAVGQTPHDLDVVAEVEGVSAQRDVARDHDDAHDEDVDGDAARDERARRHA